MKNASDVLTGSRTSFGLAIANSRLLALEDEKLDFTWKDYGHAGWIKVMTLDVTEFIRRVLLHVLPGSSVRGK